MNAQSPYPTAGFAARKGQDIHFRVPGDQRLNCRMMVIKTGRTKLPDMTITLNSSKEPLKGTAADGGNLHYVLGGNQRVSISWIYR